VAPELPLDVAPELLLDVAPELLLDVAPELPLDVAPELLLERPPELPLEPAPDVLLERPPELLPVPPLELGPDVLPELAPDVLPELPLLEVAPEPPLLDVAPELVVPLLPLLVPLPLDAAPPDPDEAPASGPLGAVPFVVPHALVVIAAAMAKAAPAVRYARTWPVIAFLREIREMVGPGDRDNRSSRIHDMNASTTHCGRKRSWTAGNIGATGC
jgi:hypothetical protein